MSIMAKLLSLCLFLVLKGSESAVSTAQAAELVFWHNKARANYAATGNCANMVEMVWDPAVANVATAYTEACGTGSPGVANANNPHNANRNADFLQGVSTGTVTFGPASAAEQALMGQFCNSADKDCLGENYAAGGGSCVNGGLCAAGGQCGGAGQPSCESDGVCGGAFCTLQAMAYNGWYLGETVNGAGLQCIPLNGGTVNGKTVEGGHCSQMLWQNSEFLGCDWKYCTGFSFGYAMICDYGPLGNFNVPDYAVAFVGDCVTGAACSKCDADHPYCTSNGLCSRTNPSMQNALGSTTSTGTTTTNAGIGNSNSSAIAGAIVGLFMCIALFVGGIFYYKKSNGNLNLPFSIPNITGVSIPRINSHATPWKNNVSNTTNNNFNNKKPSTYAPVKTNNTSLPVKSNPALNTSRPAALMPPKTTVAKKLPFGWSEEKDPSSGKTYYFHAVSGESRWERPQ